MGEKMGEEVEKMGVEVEKRIEEVEKRGVEVEKEGEVRTDQLRTPKATELSSEAVVDTEASKVD